MPEVEERSRCNVPCTAPYDVDKQFLFVYLAKYYDYYTDTCL